MKTTLLWTFLFAAILPATAQEEKRDAPREGDKHESPEGDQARAEKRKAVAAEKERVQAAAKEQAVAENERAHGEAGAMKERITRRLKEAMQEVAELLKAGRKDAAESRRREAEQEMKAASAALEARMRKEADSDFNRKSEKQRPDGQPNLELGAKLKHLEQAIGHLREAGLTELAEAASHAADRVRAALRGNGDRPREEARKEEPRRDAPQNEVEALRREIQELRQAVRQLAEKQGH